MGCVTTQRDSVKLIVERHPQGVRDAISASTEAAEFVRDTLKTINSLEAELERAE